MQADRCPNCGAPLTPGAAFCSYCGAPVVSAAGPLPSAGAANAPPQYPPTPAGPYPGPSAAPPRRSRGRVLLIVLLVVIVLIVAAFAVDYFLFPAPAVQVEEINIWAPDNVCGLNANPIFFYGYNSSTGASQTLDFGMPNFNATACTIVSVTTNSTGFSLSDVQVPLTIPGGDTAGASMNITITSPGSPFTGTMNLVLA